MLTSRQGRRYPSYVPFNQEETDKVVLKVRSLQMAQQGAGSGGPVGQISMPTDDRCRTCTGFVLL